METDSPQSAPAVDRTTKALRIVLGLVAGVILAAAAWLSYAYASSPVPVRQPQHAHYHFRLQVINSGVSVNFASARFQTPFNTDICSAALTKEPIHFHDNADQFVHIHWSGMTGGLLLKDYGWNYIGGLGSVLGYKFAGIHWPQAVPIHGQALPTPASGAKFYVYTGDQDSYQYRSWNDFLHQDLKQFFAGTPVSRADEAAQAKLNDVIGNVVIFAQKDQPTPAQVKDRFNHLLPLPTSSCSG